MYFIRNLLPLAFQCRNFSVSATLNGAKRGQSKLLLSSATQNGSLKKPNVSKKKETQKKQRCPIINPGKQQKSNARVIDEKKEKNENSKLNSSREKKMVDKRELSSTDVEVSIPPYLAFSLRVLAQAIIPSDANIQLFVAFNSLYAIATNEEDFKYSLGKMVPSVLVKKGLDSYSYHLFTSPIAVTSRDQADAFISVCGERLVAWASSHGIPIKTPNASGSGTFGTKDHSGSEKPFLKLIPSNDMWVENDLSDLQTEATSSANVNNESFTSWNGAGRVGNTEEGGHPKGGKRSERVTVKVEATGLKRASEVDSVTHFHQSQAALFQLSDEGVLKGSDESLLKTSPLGFCPTSSPVLSSVREIVNRNYSCNMFYFHKENIQSVQNKRNSVLYKQIRLIQSALSGSGSGADGVSGFVSVKILPWAQYHSHFNYHEMLRGHTMEAIPVTLNQSSLLNSDANSTSEHRLVMLDISSATPHSLDTDAFFVSVELFTGDVMEAGQLANNGRYPPLEFAKPEILLRSSVLPQSESSREVAGIFGSNGDAPTLSVVDSTRMWASTNRRFFVRFANDQHGPLGVLREMLAQLIEALGIGTDQMFAEENYLCRKLDSNVSAYQPRNFTEILTRHFLGMPLTTNSTFLHSQSSFFTEVQLGMCGNYLIGPDGDPLKSIFGQNEGQREEVGFSVAETEDSLHWGSDASTRTFNGGRSREAALSDMRLDNLFCPLSGFPAVTLGYGVGSSKKEATDPGLIMMVRRNFFKEIGQGAESSSSSSSLQDEGACDNGVAHRLLRDRLRGLFGPPPILLSTSPGCAASRFTNVKLSSGLINLNTEFYTALWTPYLECIQGAQTSLAQGTGQSNLQKSTLDPWGVSMSSTAYSGSDCSGGHLALAQVVAPEERAIMALRVALASHSSYKGVGFTIISTVNKPKVSSSSHLSLRENQIEEDFHPELTTSVWTSEVVLNNENRTVIGVGSGPKKMTSKHAAILAALNVFAPEVVLTIPKDTFVHSAEESTNVVSNTNDVQENRDEFEAFGSLLEEHIPNEGSTLLSPPTCNVWSRFSENTHTEVPSLLDSLISTSPEPHQFKPSSSIVSLYRRALQMQLEIIVSEAQTNASIEGLGDGYWSTREPLRELFQQARKSKNFDDLFVEEIIHKEVSEGSTSAEDVHIRYRCTLFALGRGDRLDNLNPDRNRLLLATSSSWPSPPLARLNALSTAFQHLVYDAALLNETALRLGGGIAPWCSISAPSVASVCDICMYHLGSRASVVRTGTVTSEGRNVTCSNVFVPSSSKDTPQGESTSELPESWPLVSVFHANANNAQQIAMLTAIKILGEASLPSGSVPALPSRVEACSHITSAPPSPPPIAFTVRLGGEAKGFLAKVLTLLDEEERCLKNGGLKESFLLPSYSATICMNGFADPSRLRMLWDDRMVLGFSNPRGAVDVRFLHVLDETIRALRVGAATFQEGTPSKVALESGANSNNNSVASEAASAVHKIIDTSAPVMMSLHRYDPSDDSTSANITCPGNISLPAAVAATTVPCKGLLAAVDALFASRIASVAELYAHCRGYSSDNEAVAKFRELLEGKVEAVRRECMCTTDARTAITSVEETIELLCDSTTSKSLPPSLSSAIASSPVVRGSSSSVLGSRRAFNKSKHFKYTQYLERFVLMLFGRSLDVFYSRPSVVRSSTCNGDYNSSSTHFEPLGSSEAGRVDWGAGAASGGLPPARDEGKIVHNWYCVLGVELFGDEYRSLLSEALSPCHTADSSKGVTIPPLVSRRIVKMEGGSLDEGCLIAVGELADTVSVAAGFKSQRCATSVTGTFGSNYTTDVDSLRKGFGGSISDVRQGFVVLGFGSGETKKEAHSAAAMHALRWHFPVQLQELIRRGVQW